MNKRARHLPVAWSEIHSATTSAVQTSSAAKSASESLLDSVQSSAFVLTDSIACQDPQESVLDGSSVPIDSNAVSDGASINSLASVASRAL